MKQVAYPQRAGCNVTLHAIFFILCVLTFSLNDRLAWAAEPVPETQAPKAVSQAPSVLSAPKEYTIGPEDVLEVSVWGEADLSKSFAVSPEGTINYPLLGVIEVDALTPGALEEQLRERLSQGYLKDPKVTVSIKEFNSKKITVFGMMGVPGLYKVRGDITLLEFLSMVGVGGRGSGTRLVIMRKDPKNPQALPKPAVEVNLDDLLIKADLTKNIIIKPGDVVYSTVTEVSKRRFYVMGQVRSPGPYEFTTPITLMEAIKLGGGLTEYAAPRRVQVIRKEGEKKITLKFNLNDITTGKKNDDFVIQAGDVVVVPESWF